MLTCKSLVWKSEKVLHFLRDFPHSVAQSWSRMSKIAEMLPICLPNNGLSLKGTLTDRQTEEYGGRIVTLFQINRL